MGAWLSASTPTLSPAMRGPDARAARSTSGDQKDPPGNRKPAPSHPGAGRVSQRPSPRVKSALASPPAKPSESAPDAGSGPSSATLGGNNRLLTHPAYLDIPVVAAPARRCVAQKYHRAAAAPADD